MTETVLPPLPPDDRPDQAPQWTEGLSVLSIAVAGLALVAAVIAIGYGARAIGESKRNVGSSSGTSVSKVVSLTEFTIPAVSLPAGGSLHVMNDGTTEHNLAIEGTKLTTKNLAADASEHLDIATLAAGSYTMFCTIPGHRDAGMHAALTVGGAAAASDDATSHASMDYAAMTQAMTKSMTAFPAATAGTGNPQLQPTEVLADGTKVFDLVAVIAKWERAPGDIVDAWTYNGVVPAPSIRLNIGDKAKFRLRNDLPIATDLHLHGLNIDNRFDGVAPLTQAPIAPGETFTYEYTADEVAVAMYHPHFHSQLGLPNGMFGTILVGEVPLPAGRTISGIAIPSNVTIAQELPMVLNDSGVIGYSLNGKSFPATAPIVGRTGDWILVHYYNEGSQTHPMHLHKFDQIVIARDGFTIDHPYVTDTQSVAPGERYSVLIKLDKAGTWVWHCHILPHVENDEGMFGMVTAVVVKD